MHEKEELKSLLTGMETQPILDESTLAAFQRLGEALAVTWEAVEQAVEEFLRRLWEIWQTIQEAMREAMLALERFLLQDFRKNAPRLVLYARLRRWMPDRAAAWLARNLPALLVRWLL